MAKDRYRLHFAAMIFLRRVLALLAAGMIAVPIASSAQTACSRPVTDAIPLVEKMERSWAEVSDYTSTLVKYEFDLDDGRLMNGQHHPLPDSTIAGMMDLISVNLKTAARRREGSMCFHADELVDGGRAIKLEVLFPSGAGLWHTVAKGETLWTIGKDYGQDRYVIQYNNPSAHPGKALPAGTRIFVPRYYAARVLIWASESSYLPVKLHMYDAESRLYEAYSNIDLRLDVGLTAEDFDPVLYGFPAVASAGEESSKDASNSR